MLTDTIADLLARIKNAQARGHESVVAPYSKMKHALAVVLEKNGYIAGVEVLGKSEKKSLKLILKYDENGRPAISQLKKVSRLGQRIYIKKDKIKPHDYITLIVSTSKGLMSDKEAKKMKLGGELICKIW